MSLRSRVWTAGWCGWLLWAAGGATALGAALHHPLELPAAGGGVETRDIDLLTPPGRFIDIGSHRLHLFCVGAGRPTVVLEAGVGGFSLEWLGIQRELQGEYRVCSYDRGGYGWSEAGPRPRTAARLAKELALVLELGGEEWPYLLVGHSFGGYTVQYFAKRYPQRTAGIVLVDSSHPEQVRRLPALPQWSMSEPRFTGGLGRYIASWPELPQHFPAEVKDLAFALMQTRKARQAQYYELREFLTSGDEIRQAGPMPDVPAVVLSRGDRAWPSGSVGDRVESLWFEMQGELAQALPRARHFVIAGSAHHIHLDRPREVVQAIRTVAAEVAACTTVAAPGGVSAAPPPSGEC